MKQCVKCKQVKPLDDFHSQGGGTKRGQCRICYNTNWKYRLMSTLCSREAMRKRPHGGGIKKSIIRDKNINGEFLENLKAKQNGMCYWLKIPIDFTMKDTLRKVSLDRLDNSKGYLLDNVVLTTVFANTARRDATIDEMNLFLKNYLNI